MNDMIIREMYIDDYDHAHALWSRVEGMSLGASDSRENISRFLERSKGLSFICEAQGKIIGTVLCSHDFHRGYIYHLAVDEQYRGKGIGRELVSRCLEKLKQEGIPKCHIFVFKGNETGMNFWHGTGWKKRDDVYVFSKDL